MSRNFLFENENGSIVRLSRLFVALENFFNCNHPVGGTDKLTDCDTRVRSCRLGQRPGKNAGQPSCGDSPVKNDRPILNRSKFLRVYRLAV
jgi:hypothetical protein